MGRLGYAYAHGIMVAGVTVVAVAIDLIIDHPTGPISVAAAAVIFGGPILYLAGNALFNYALSGRAPWSRLIGIGVLVVLAPLALIAAPLILGVVTMVVLLTLAFATGTPHQLAKE